MYLSQIGPLALFLSVGNAFINTSPFFYFSTTDDPTSSPSVSRLSPASTILETIKTRISSCKSDAYVIVSQPGAASDDFRTRRAAPRLAERVNLQDGVRSSFRVDDVQGVFDLDRLQQSIEDRCEATSLAVDASTGSFDTIADMKPRVMRVDFPRLAEDHAERMSQLSQNDAFLSSILDLLPSSKYTVIYTTTPVASSADRLASQAFPPVDAQQRLGPYKRGLDSREAKDNVTLVDGPLFQRYQFFTPALFMALLASAVLLAILSLGLGGLSSLKVSYAAFEKESGPVGAGKRQ